MLFNKDKRIKYLGFNDFWFVVIGILVLSLVIDFIFNNSFATRPLIEALITWGVSLFFTICNWFIIRPVIILLRKSYPDLKDISKRLVLLFLAVVSTVLLVDFVGNKLLSVIFDQRYRSMSSSQILLPIIIISTMTMAIYEAIYYYTKLKTSIIEKEQAKQAITQAQLDTLRNQAQPHFLFNSLNTLRDIIDENSKEDAKKFVDKLADVYRFILESGSANLIPLRDELRFAKSYIHVQSERFGDNLKLNWNIPEASLGAMIVPMSLQLLLENAIKHNVIARSKPLVINVDVKDNLLIVNNHIQSKSTQLPSTKVGLKNIEKRYNLISGKPVEVSNDGNQFTVSLPLLKISDQNKQP